VFVIGTEKLLVHAKNMTDARPRDNSSYKVKQTVRKRLVIESISVPAAHPPPVQRVRHSRSRLLVISHMETQFVPS
jgi:hypothetical protein